MTDSLTKALAMGDEFVKLLRGEKGCELDAHDIQEIIDDIRVESINDALDKAEMKAA